MNLQKRKNRQNVVAIFAHPDDEAFGPGGTIYKLSKNHNVYIICATKGEAGGTHKNIAQIRTHELSQCAKILGVKEIFFLGFRDGMLSNAIYHKIASKIEAKLNELEPTTVITFEPRGVSGHIDHVVISLVTTYVFKKSKYIKKLMYYCISDQERKKFSDQYFVYFPPGYKKSDISETFDVSDVWSIKVRAMRTHSSQKEDVSKFLSAMEKAPKVENFMTLKNK